MNELDILQALEELEAFIVSNLSESLTSKDWVFRRAKAYQDYMKKVRAIVRKYDFGELFQDKLIRMYKRFLNLEKIDIRKHLHIGLAERETPVIINEARLKKLFAEYVRRMSEATKSTNILRQASDVYRRAVLAGEAAMSTGTVNLWEAIDMSVNEFLKRGLVTVPYANGARMQARSYVEMALRTGAIRAKLHADGDARRAYGVSLVLVSQYGACSDICLPWQGRVYIDDVFSGGRPGRYNYPLLSEAVAAGLFHPNCRHTSNTYYEGITKIPPPVNPEKAERAYKLEQRQRYIERQIRSWKRLEAGSADDKKIARSKAKVKEWQETLRDFISAHPETLRRDYEREQI
ncbi:MAG: phage minor capsid protein [Clostridiales bacterium]|jgi:hypothetical protein|nr:phage minor capsid protein [Clostridiales bacterium]